MRRIPLLRPVAFCTLAAFGLFFQPGCAESLEPSARESESVGIFEAQLRRHVAALAGDIGERHVFRPAALESAAAYIEAEFRRAGYEPRRLPVSVPAGEPYGLAAPVTVWNIDAVKPGASPDSPILVVGAHYDTRVAMSSWHAHGPANPARLGTPGANDNGSGVAALLEVARRVSGTPTRHEVRFVAYVNEEPPFFKTEAMGSRVHARALAASVPGRVTGMISLETLGVYSPRPNKKRSSAPGAAMAGLPDSCDYVAFMSTATGRKFSSAFAAVFEKNCGVPARVVSFPYVSRGVAWSDDWSYMKSGIPSFAVTDTAYLRCDDYHETSDTPDRLDYPVFTEVVRGVADSVVAVAAAP